MRKNKGFTLLELLIVLAIIGILAAAAVPGYMAWSNNAKFKDAAGFASSAMRQAKGHAININQKVVVKFTLDDSAANSANTLQIIDVHDTPIPFPSGIEIRGKADCTKVTGDLSITFNPNGSAGSGDGYYICVYDGATKKYRTGLVNPVTGRIVSQKWTGTDWK